MSSPFHNTVSLRIVGRLNHACTAVLRQADSAIHCRFGKEAPQAGQQIEATVGKVLYIQGGAEGPRGWKVGVTARSHAAHVHACQKRMRLLGAPLALRTC